MNNKTESNAKSGWAFLGLLTTIAFVSTLIGQFFGVAWFWPWLFLGMIIFVAAQHEKAKEASKPVEEEPKLPHLTTIPGQYTRKPCDKPSWISIPLYRDYEIHCVTHQVRNKHTGDVVQPGYDPTGRDNRLWLELGYRDGRLQYELLDWVVATALGKGHL